MKLATRSLLILGLTAGLALTGCKKEEGTASNGAGEAVTNVAFVNTMCPIMEGEIDPTVAGVEYMGQTIGFCCDGCQEKFEAKADEWKKEYLTQFVPDVTGEVDPHDN